MLSQRHACLVSALLLAVLPQRALGAPVEDAPTDSPAGEPSGDDGEALSAPDTLTLVLESALGETKRHKQEFLDEFLGEVKYDFLDHYNISSLPASCPYSNFSKEACLRRLLQGLLLYRTLLKHVEKEYPSSSIPSGASYYSGLLIRELERKVKDSAQIPALTSSQEEQLLREIDYRDTFHRKMAAHSILYKLHYFLVDCKRVIVNKRGKRSGSGRGTAPVTFYDQRLTR